MDSEKKKNFIIHVLYILIWVGIACVVFSFGFSLLSPFWLALLFAYFLHRPALWLSQKSKLKYKFSALITTTIFFAIIGMLISLVGIKALSSIGSLVKNLPSLYSTHIEPIFKDVLNTLESFFYQFDTSLFAVVEDMNDQVVKSMGGFVTDISVSAMSAVSGFATALPGLFIKLVLLIISTYFITMDYDKLTGFVLRQLRGKGKDLVLQIKNYVIGTLFVCIRSYALIMFITFVELSIGLSIIGIKYAVPVAALISIFDILPVLGTGGIMIPWTVIMLLQGEFGTALGLLIVYVAITVIRNIIEPKIVGGQLGLHPVVTLASMFAGVQIFGVVGLFGFPIGLSLLRHLDQNGTISVFRKEGQNKSEND